MWKHRDRLQIEIEDDENQSYLIQVVSEKATDPSFPTFPVGMTIAGHLD
ncbi:hypothetical protein CCP3SC1_1290001 [Gammaproteobacteria bacterium]